MKRPQFWVIPFSQGFGRFEVPGTRMPFVRMDKKTFVRKKGPLGCVVRAKIFHGQGKKIFAAYGAKAKPLPALGPISDMWTPIEAID